MGTDLISAPALSFGVKWRNCQSLTGITIHQSKLLSFIYFWYLWVLVVFVYLTQKLGFHTNWETFQGVEPVFVPPGVNLWWIHVEILVHMARSIGQDMPYLLLPSVPRAVSRDGRAHEVQPFKSALWDTDRPSSSRDKGTWIKQLNIRRGTGEALIHVLVQAPALHLHCPSWNSDPYLSWNQEVLHHLQ